MPIARMPYSATCLATVSSAPALKKLSAVMLKKISRTINTINVRPFKRVIANLLFPDFVDHIQLPLPVASTLLERITFYAKKNRDELDKLSCKWCCD